MTHLLPWAASLGWSRVPTEESRHELHLLCVRFAALTVINLVLEDIYNAVAFLSVDTLDAFLV